LEAENDFAANAVAEKDKAQVSAVKRDDVLIFSGLKELNGGGGEDVFFRLARMRSYVHRNIVTISEPTQDLGSQGPS
jgi:hypothetical protein